MKKIILFLIGFLGFLNLYAQAPLIPSVRCSLTTVTVFTDPYTVTGKTSDFSSNWQASDITAGDSLYLLDGSELRVYRVQSITSASGVDFTIVIDDINNSGNVPVTGEYGALFRGTTNYEFPNVTAGISETLQMAIQNRFVQRLDALLKGIGTDYITTDSFTTFTNGATFASIPLNKTVWSTTRGSKWEKTASGTMTRRSQDNGSNALLGFTQAGSTLIFNSRLYNRVKLNTGDISAATISNPTYYTLQDNDETFQIGVTTGTSDVVLTWGSIYGVFNNTTYDNMPTITVPAQSTMYFQFRVVWPSAESVKFRYVDGGASGIGGLTYVTQTTAPSDTTKLWLDNTKTLEWPMKQRVNGTWRIIGWYVPLSNYYTKNKPMKVLSSGQSNAEYRTGASNKPKDKRVIENTSGTTWAVANHTSDNGIGLQFAYNVATNEDRCVFLKNVALASQPIEKWYPDSTQYNLITAHIAANNIDSFNVFAFRQGERNADLGDTEAQYAAKVKIMIEGFRALPQFKNTVFILGGMNESYYNTGPFDYYYHLNNGENGGNNTVGVNMLGLSRVGGIHIDGASVDTVGTRYYEAYKGQARQYSLNKTPYVYWISNRELAIEGGSTFPAFRAVESAQGRRGVYYKYDDSNNVGVLGLNGTVNGTTANDLDILFWDHEKVGLGGRNALLAQNRAILQLLPGRSFMPFSLRVATSAGISKFQLDTVGVFTKPIEMFDQGAARGNIWLKHSSASAFESGRIRFTKNNNSATWIGSYIHNDGSANLFHLGTHPGNDTLIGGDINVVTLPRAGNGIGIKTTTVDAYLKIAAGTATAGTAPLRFTSGTLNTTPAVGAMEFLTDRLYFTKTTGATRETIAYLSDIGSGTGDILNGGNSGVVTIGSNDNTLNLEAGGTTWISTTSVGNTTLTVNDNTSNGFVMAIEGGGANILTANTTDGAEITSIGTSSIGSTLTLASEVTRINGSQGITLRTISASGTSAITNGDFHIRLDATTGAKTLTLPAPTYNMVLQFFRFDNNPATVITFTGTINGVVNPTTTGANSPVGLLANQYSVVELKYNGTSWEVNAETGDILNGGNAGAVVIGSNSSTTAIESNGTTRLSFGSTGDVTSTIPDNTTGAWLVNSSDGQGFVTVNTTNAAPRMVLGSSEAGAAIGQQGIRYEDVQAISASGAFTATKSTITLNLSSTGTVDANLTGWPTSSSVASELVLVNIHPTSSVTVDVTGAGWSGSSPVIAPGGVVTAKLINGTLYR